MDDIFQSFVSQLVAVQGLQGPSRIFGHFSFLFPFDDKDVLLRSFGTAIEDQSAKKYFIIVSAGTVTLDVWLCKADELLASWLNYWC